MGSSWARKAPVSCVGRWIPSTGPPGSPRKRYISSPDPSSYEWDFIWKQEQGFCRYQAKLESHWMRVGSPSSNSCHREETKGIGSCEETGVMQLQVKGMPGATKAVWGRDSSLGPSEGAGCGSHLWVFGLSSLHNCERRAKHQTWVAYQNTWWLVFVVFCYGRSRK